MSTIVDVVTEALLMLGVQAEGERLSAARAEGALRVLHTMVDGWALEHLLVYTLDRQVFALVAGTASYTLGPGGTWNTTPLYGVGAPRPVTVEVASWQDPSTLLETPLRVLAQEEVDGLRQSSALSAAQPRLLHYTPTFPLGTVLVWPTPNTAGNVVLWLGRPWDTAWTLAQAVILPPGYQRMLEANLAVDLSLRYPGTLRPEVAALAIESKAKVKNMNHVTPRMVSDVPQGQGAGGLGAWSSWLSGGG